DKTKGFVQVRDALDLKRMMVTVVIALQPVVFMACWNTGYQIFQTGEPILGWRADILIWLGILSDSGNNSVGNSGGMLAMIALGALYFIPLYLVTNIVGGIWEVLFSIVRGKQINEGFLVTGFLFPLILPPDVPLWMVALGISFGVVIGKEIFGGTGMNFINVALLSRAFLFFAYPADLSGDRIWIAVDGYTQATVLGAVANAETFPYTWMDAFLGFIPGSMGETSALACLLGGAYLIWSRISSWRIVLGMLASFSLTILFLNYVGSNPVTQMSLDWHLVVGGFAFGTIYMATDPVTASMTNTGRWIYGALCGFLSALIRAVNPAFPEGVMLAILLANVFAPTIDYFVVEANKKRRRLRETHEW
ncbi:MAG: NADH:ubiquinone reductase (Na(+)-transporting) subunit B, partial [Leptospira sp.]|nr:NADH:ubiquinone reductase (Na(+)-transporting) subunit B [Leptospira sp.]